MIPEPSTSPAPRGTTIVSADHPSFGGDIDRFLDEFRREPRCFGPTAKTNPKPFPSLLEALLEALRLRGGFRLAAVEAGRVVGLARVDGDGELFIAVVADRRSNGIGVELGRAALAQAAELHYRRVLLRSSRRSRAARRVGEQLGCIVVDHVLGRTDLILAPSDVTYQLRSA